MGHKATSQAGKLVVAANGYSISIQDFEIIDPIAVPNEPDDYYGLIGDTVTFVVEAEGKGLTYQWMRWNEETELLEPCYEDGYNTPTLRVPLTLDMVGAEFRCFIYDSDGNGAATRSAYVYLDIRDWSYSYNADGLRTERSSDNLTYSYVYSGDKLVRMTVDGNDMDFFYDANGTPYALKYMGSTYYYITNLQGDVVSIVDETGLTIALYEYDAWGNILKETGSLALRNPLRYRGYVYDQETRLYYLNSRYYDPAVGRFINFDNQLPLTYSNIAEYNLFSYCLNNPINVTDPDGHWPLWKFDIEKAINDLLAVLIKVVCLVTSAQIMTSNSSSHDINRRPYTGAPGSTYRAPNGDTRTYGPDGKPQHDYDHSDHGAPSKHPHDKKGGHNHDWINGKRGPAYASGIEMLAGATLITVGLVGVTFVVLDDATGIGVFDDFLVTPLGSAIYEGLIILFM